MINNNIITISISFLQVHGNNPNKSYIMFDNKSFLDASRLFLIYLNKSNHKIWWHTKLPLVYKIFVQSCNTAANVSSKEFDLQYSLYDGMTVIEIVKDIDFANLITINVVISSMRIYANGLRRTDSDIYINNWEKS